MKPNLFAKLAADLIVLLLTIIMVAVPVSVILGLVKFIGWCIT